jgi:hypothetical protein
MKSILALILLFSSFGAFCEQPKTQVITNDNRVVYSIPDKQLYSVQKQTVCKQVNGKQECYDRAVATQVQR